MKLYIDSADCTQWAAAAGSPRVAGVTTNPSLVWQAGQPVEQSTYVHLIQMASKLGLPELMLQMPSPDAQEVDAYLSELLPTAERAQVKLTIKLPCLPEWQEAIEVTRSHAAPVLLTGLSNAVQLMWAVDMRANWVAPYVGRLEDAGRDVWSLVQACVEAQAHGTHLLAASIKTPDVLARLFAAGASAVTVRPDLLNAWVQDDMTQAAVAQFAADIQASRSL